MTGNDCSDVRTQSVTTIHRRNETCNPRRLYFGQLASYGPEGANEDAWPGAAADAKHDVAGLNGVDPPPTLDPVIIVRT
jgi:hypothetical protein